MDRSAWQDVDGAGSSGHVWIGVTLDEAKQAEVETAFDAYQAHLAAGKSDEAFEVAPLKLRLVNFDQFDRSLHHGEFVGLYDNVIVGTWRSETLVGTDDRDLILGLGGNDVLKGVGNDDILIGGTGYDTFEGGAGDDIFLFTGTGTGYDKFNGGDGEDRVVAAAPDTEIGINGYANGVEAFEGTGDTIVRDSWRSKTLDFSNTRLVGVAEVDAGSGNDTIIASDLTSGTYRGGSGYDTLDAGTQDTMWLFAGSGNSYDTFRDNGTATVVAKAESAGTVIGVNGYTNGVDIFRGHVDGDTIVRDSWRSKTLDFSNTQLVDIAEVDAGSGNDTIIASDLTSGAYRGNSGYDTLDAGTQETTWLFAGDGNGYDIFQDNGTATVVAKAESAGTVIGVNGYANGVDTFQGHANGDTVIRDSWRSKTLDFSNTQLVDIGEVDAGSGNDTIVASDLTPGTYRGGSGYDNLYAGASDTTWAYAGDKNGYDNLRDNGAATVVAKAESRGTVIGIGSYENGVDMFGGHASGDTIVRNSWRSDTLDFSETQLVDIAEVDAASGNDTVFGSNLTAGAYRGGPGNDTLIAGSQATMWLYVGVGDGLDSFEHNGNAEVQATVDDSSTPGDATQSTTNTGLDRLVDIIVADPGLNRRVDPAEIAEGAAAADAMNHIILAAIDATGLANDDEINTADMYDLNAWIQANRYDQWATLHGDDETYEETGFHLVQNDGAITYLFGANNAVNTVADGLYHMGFDIVAGRFLNEDGNRNVRVEKAAHWLDTLLREDLADGALRNPDVDPYTRATTGTGLDSLVEIIIADPGLNQKIATSDIMAGAKYANAMNGIIVAAIKATGLANDGEINTADVRDLNAYIQANHQEEWVTLHGDDEDGGETGFHLVQNDGATTRLYDRNAVNTVADGIYHLGFDIAGDNVLNEDGNRNARVETLAAWFSSLLREDLASGALRNPDVNPYAEGTTGTGLDSLVDIITSDPVLNRKIPTNEITTAAKAADAMNQIIIAAINATGLANNGEINAADMRDLNAWIQANRYDDWVELHGDDEGDEETGFHLVQNDGAIARLFANNAVNTVADGLYHIGFDIVANRFLNEDGDRNVSVETAALWLDELLESDLASGSLNNPNVDPYAEATTGTGLDSLVDIIAGDPGLNLKIPTSEITAGAEYADAMNHIIIAAITATGAGNDGEIDVFDMQDINAYIQANHYDKWVELHGDDEGDEETGFHLVQNDGATSRLYSNNAVNTVADGLYHIGFDIVRGRFLNEDGNKNVSVETAAFWLGNLLEEDLESGGLVNPNLVPDPAEIAAAEVFSVDSVMMEAPDDYVEVPHTDTLALANGTVAVSFNADDVSGRRTLFSKDASGYGTGGHLTAFVRNGRVEVRLQDTSKSVWMYSQSLIKAGEPHHLAVSFGEDGFRVFVDGKLEAARSDFTTGIDTNSENLAIGASTWARSDYRPDWTADYFDGTIEDVTIYNRALSRTEIASIGGDVAVAGPTSGTTGTGLDALVDIIFDDLGLYRRVDPAEIDEGAAAADALNHIIIDAIQATGLANDGEINAADMRDLNAWIQANRYDDWVEFHGDDEGDEETGFHFVQNDGAITRLFANNAVNTVADGLYHIGFDIVANRFLNEDGNRNVSVETAAWWLDELLEDDLAEGTLSNANVDPYAEGTTGTGLDSLVDIIIADPGLNLRIPTSEITAGAEYADAMNHIIIEAITATGLANDGEINTADVRDVNAYIQANHYERWVDLHGDDEGGEETGFHLVQNDGATTRLYANNAVNTVADGIYHLGFDIQGDRILNEDGNRNARVETLAWWLNDLLAEDLASGALSNTDVNPYAEGTTGTGLDSLVEIVTADPYLNLKIATSEITAGARAADAMNLILIEAIKATGVANDGEINAADVRDLNAYIQANHYEKWVELHGDDGGDEETGFHLVQNDGAISRLFDNNAVNTVADGIYHLGFDIVGNNVLNEDGNRNARVETLAWWLNDLLAEDLADGSLSNPGVDPYAAGTTGTGLDKLVALVAADPDLNRKIATSEITAGARAANRMNEILIEAIEATGAAKDGQFDMYDMININVYIQANHSDEWVELHGDDEGDEETGFHLVQNDGATTRLFGENAVNTVADGIYHVGFDIERGSFENEDGNRNLRLRTAAHWLNQLLRQELADKVFAAWGG